MQKVFTRGKALKVGISPSKQLSCSKKKKIYENFIDALSSKETLFHIRDFDTLLLEF